MSIAGDLIRGHTDAVILARLMRSDSYGYEMDMVLTLGQEVLDGVSQSFQQSGINPDASWLREIGLHMEMNYDGDLVQTIVDAQLGGNSVIGADVIVDMVGGMSYVGVPAIQDQYIGSKMDMFSYLTHLTMCFLYHHFLYNSIMMYC